MSDFRWTHVETKEEAEAFYSRLLPKLRLSAREHGYALGLHGSLRRDLDLIAAPWTAEHSDKNTLARALHRAACGLEMREYAWTDKPCGRVAVSFPICFTGWNEPNAGHIDLSVMPGRFP